MLIKPRHEVSRSKRDSAEISFDRSKHCDQIILMTEINQYPGICSDFSMLYFSKEMRRLHCKTCLIYLINENKKIIFSSSAMPFFWLFMFFLGAFGWSLSPPPEKSRNQIGAISRRPIWFYIGLARSLNTWSKTELATMIQWIIYNSDSVYVIHRDMIRQFWFL